MNYTNPDYLWSPQQLHEHLDDANLRLFDVSVFLVPQGDNFVAQSGAASYADAHIPGAAFLDQLTRLSVTDAPLRFTLPPIEHLSQAFADAGIGADEKVVFYSSGHFMWATRAWWLLHHCGHSNCAVLDGGLPGWRAAGYGVETTPNSYAPAKFAATPRAVFADVEQVAATCEADTHVTVNALTPGMYAGTSPISYGRPGHIPGSINLPYDSCMQRRDDVETLLPAAELAQVLEAKGMLGTKPVITYCGGGIAATVDAFSCLLLGKTDVAVYDGSLGEWVSDPARPMTVGPDAG